MTCPGGGIYVVQGEMSILLTAMRRGARWSSHSHQDEEHDSLGRSFTELKDALNQVSDLHELESNQFLGPFLEVIRSEETTGPVTSQALAAVDKFLAYGLLDASAPSTAATVENIADAVTHARFVGTDQASDGVVLMKILQVLRTLMISTVGILLTNESVCEIMLSCFRISFESRLSELLRRAAEHCLKDTVQLLFQRLPQFCEDLRAPSKLRMRTGAVDPARSKRKKRKATPRPTECPVASPAQQPSRLATSPVGPGGNIVDMQGSIHQGSVEDVRSEGETVDSSKEPSISESTAKELPSAGDEGISKPSEETAPEVNSKEIEQPAEQNGAESPQLQLDAPKVGGDSEEAGDSVEKVVSCEEETPAQSVDGKEPECAPDETVLVTGDGEILSAKVLSEAEVSASAKEVAPETTKEASEEGGAAVKPGEGQPQQEYVNPQGVRFMNDDPNQEGNRMLVPYGVACVRELLRFLISLCNPMDKQNTEGMTHMGLTLLTVALEVGADSIGGHVSLMGLVKDELCRNLVALLASERLSIFAADLQVSFLLFEALRSHLKFQLELFLSRLADLVVSESPRVSYEHKEVALESIVQLWRVPGLVTELYLNYDCDLHCPNLFEDLTKLLSKNAFPVTGLYNTHLLSLDALLTVVDSIEAHCHSRILNQGLEGRAGETEPSGGLPSRRGRQVMTQHVPSHEELMALKRKKKLLSTGTQQFNTKARKGVTFLQEHGLLSSPLDPQEVALFLRENPHLDKKMIGEFLSARGNMAILDSFVKSFDFTELRIDEALRLYLETFRLPGESPLISLIMEHFADHWHKCNGEPFANADAAFTLAYAVIMLNVDQHNHNVKRQNNPMTAAEFKRNLKNVNGGCDFDQDMLDDIYNAVKTEEIVMPAEQTGLVRENYLWKVLLRRGTGRDGTYLHSPEGLFDHDLFSLVWGPTVAALSFVFDRSSDPLVYQRAIAGFRKCAMISAHYGMSSDFDNLVISLCKFTGLLGSEPPETLTLQFGANPKAQLAAQTVFSLAHRHGDTLREGWRNVLECVLALYRCKLLPKILVEAEDFVEPSGKVSLLREEAPCQKAETGLLSSLYSYIALATSEPGSQKGPSAEDREYLQIARRCVRDCYLEQLVSESKFLRLDSLQELVKALIFASHGPDASGTTYDEDAAVFFLELLLKVVLQNRDRVIVVWPSVRDHVHGLALSSAALGHARLAARCVVGLLRLAMRLLRREDTSALGLQSLRLLLLLRPAHLARLARHVAYGLHELLKTSAANIHSHADWAVIFGLLACVGAGAPPPRLVSDAPTDGQVTGAKSDGEVGRDDDSGLGAERGCTSDSELSKAPNRQSSSSPELSPSNGTGWILVGREGDAHPLQVLGAPSAPTLGPHDTFALVKSCESLTFLVRDVAHITPDNFEPCVQCVRTFVEASLLTGEKRGPKRATKDPKGRKKAASRKKDEGTVSSNPYDADESDSEEVSSGYHQVAIQLLDLMHTLHTRTAQIFRWWGAESVSLWGAGWCPLLQGIARLCCDSRRQVRMSAVTYLQRALLVHDLQTLSALEWEACFHQVLFPLLGRLLGPVCPGDPSGLEETRMRAATVLAKVFLHHLTPLLSLPTFAALWLTILDFMDKYMHADNSDLLYEAIPESLKNMLLVMDSAGVFGEGDSPLWSVTWDRIDAFLPQLRTDLFRGRKTPSAQQQFNLMGQNTGSSPQEMPPQFCLQPAYSSAQDAVQQFSVQPAYSTAQDTLQCGLQSVYGTHVEPSLTYSYPSEISVQGGQLLSCSPPISLVTQQPPFRVTTLPQEEGTTPQFSLLGQQMPADGHLCPENASTESSRPHNLVTSQDIPGLVGYHEALPVPGTLPCPITQQSANITVERRVSSPQDGQQRVNLSGQQPGTTITGLNFSQDMPQRFNLIGQLPISSIGGVSDSQETSAFKLVGQHSANTLTGISFSHDSLQQFSLVSHHHPAEGSIKPSNLGQQSKSLLSGLDYSQENYKQCNFVGQYPSSSSDVASLVSQEPVSSHAPVRLMSQQLNEMSLIGQQPDSSVTVSLIGQELPGSGSTVSLVGQHPGDSGLVGESAVGVPRAIPSHYFGPDTPNSGLF